MAVLQGTLAICAIMPANQVKVYRFGDLGVGLYQSVLRRLFRNKLIKKAFRMNLLFFCT